MVDQTEPSLNQPLVVGVRESDGDLLYLRPGTILDWLYERQSRVHPSPTQKPTRLPTTFTVTCGSEVQAGGFAEEAPAL